MNLLERNSRCKEFFLQCLEILDRKGADYTVCDDALKAITQLAEHLQITPEQVLWVYMYKHLAALLNWLQRGALRTEDVSERLMDIANYCALMRLFVREAVAGPAALPVVFILQLEDLDQKSHTSFFFTVDVTLSVISTSKQVPHDGQSHKRKTGSDRQSQGRREGNIPSPPRR